LTLSLRQAFQKFCPSGRDVVTGLYLDRLDKHAENITHQFEAQECVPGLSMSRDPVTDGRPAANCWKRLGAHGGHCNPECYSCTPDRPYHPYPCSTVNDSAMIRLSLTTGGPGRRLVESAWKVRSSRPVFDSHALSGLAGPSRLPFTPIYRAPAYSTHGAVRKGKQSESGWALGRTSLASRFQDASILPPFSRWSDQSSVPRRHGQIRLFHATARRQALPIIPVTIGFLKVSPCGPILV